MVSSVKDLDRSSGYTTKRYSVVGRTYELLPKPKKIAKRYTPMVAPAAPVQAPQIAPPLPTTSLMATPFHHYKPLPLPPTPAAAFDLDSMTIAEARALYTRLARMFKGDMT